MTFKPLKTFESSFGVTDESLLAEWPIFFLMKLLLKELSFDFYLGQNVRQIRIS